MAQGLGNLILAFATLTLLHATYSAYEYFSALKAIHRSGTGLQLVPRDIMIEVGLAVITFLLGVTLRAPPLQEISWASEMKKRTAEEMSNRPSFAGFRPRSPPAPVPSS